jgi:hypothetical protein
VYEPSLVPTLYVGRTEDLLGRVPLFPCFLHGNATSTIPYTYAPRQKQAFEFGCADGASQGSRWGSHAYEINTWLWNFGRPQPRVGGLLVVKTQEIRRRSRSETSHALGRPGRPGSAPPTRRSPAEEIWHSYTIHIPVINECSLKHAFGGIAWCPPPRNACVYAESDLRWQFHGRICSKNVTRTKS